MNKEELIKLSILLIKWMESLKYDNDIDADILDTISLMMRLIAKTIGDEN